MFEAFLRHEKGPRHRVEKFHHNTHLGLFSSVEKLTKSQVKGRTNLQGVVSIFWSIFHRQERSNKVQVKKEPLLTTCKEN
jgi:hypothetical protein